MVPPEVETVAMPNGDGGCYTTFQKDEDIENNQHTQVVGGVARK